MAQKIIPCGGWYIDNETLTFDENKVLSVVGGGGEAEVASFNGRTGAVVPQAGDYTAEQVGALPISGGTMTGNIDMGGNNVDHVAYVKAAGTYENAGIQFSSNGTIINFVTGNSTSMELSANSVNVANHKIRNVAGIEMSNSGIITGLGEPVNDEDAATKGYVDNAVASGGGTSGITQEEADARYVQLSGSTMTGALNMGNNKITMGATPTETTDVTNKGYVDGVVKVVSDEVDGIIAGTTPISVPVATDAKVGGVKIGAGLSVDGEGTLSTAQTYLSTQGGTMTGAIAMGSQKITGLADATDPGDALNKKVGDATYALKTAIPTNATTATAGIVKQATAIEDSSGATDTALETKFNALLAALRTAGVLASS